MCSHFVTGTALGWATAVLPMLGGTKSSDPLNDDQIGWIMSIMGAGAVTGPLFTWLFVDKIGRKPVLSMACAPMILSYVIMTVKQEYMYLMIGRVFTGVAMGVTFSVVPLFIGEITDNQIRGALGAVALLTINCGNVFTICIAPYVDLAGLNLILALVAGVLILLLFFIPESPYYHMMRGKLILQSLIPLSRI